MAANYSLAYEERGSGHPVIFAHGIPTDYRIWNSQLENFAADFRAISYSRRYASPNKNAGEVTDSTVQNNSEDLVNLIETLKLKPLHLVGHSYGGFIAAYTALKHPELFRSLVLVEPAIPSILVKNERNPFQLISFLLRNPSAAASARRFQGGELKEALSSYDAGDQKDSVKHFVDGIYEEKGAFEKLPGSLQSLMLDNSRTVGELETEFPIFTSSDARKINLPTLLVKGDKSPKWLQAIVNSMGKAVPKSTVIQISNSGHLPHAENPSEFNAGVLEFLKRNN